MTVDLVNAVLLFAVCVARVVFVCRVSVFLGVWFGFWIVVLRVVVGFDFVVGGLLAMVVWFGLFGCACCVVVRVMFCFCVGFVGW